MTVGDLVRLFTFRRATPTSSSSPSPRRRRSVGSRVGDVQWPVDTALVAIVRDTRVISPAPTTPSRPATSCCSSRPRPGAALEDPPHRLTTVRVVASVVPGGPALAARRHRRLARAG